MKTETIEILAPGEVDKLLWQKVAKHGSQQLADAALGVSQSHFGQVLLGHLKPTPKLLRPLGLEVRRVIVRRGKNCVG